MSVWYFCGKDCIEVKDASGLGVGKKIGDFEKGTQATLDGITSPHCGTVDVDHLEELPNPLKQDYYADFECYSCNKMFKAHMVMRFQWNTWVDEEVTGCESTNAGVD